MRRPFPGVVFEVGAASYGVLLLLVGAAFSGGGHDSRVATLLWSPLWLPLGILAPAFCWLAARVANRGWGRAAAALAVLHFVAMPFWFVREATAPLSALWNDLGTAAVPLLLIYAAGQMFIWTGIVRQITADGHGHD